MDSSYHDCVSCCIRRSFLRGEDKFTGQSYKHRRGWVEERLLFLSSVFSIGICAYAVMNDHIYAVLCVDKDFAHDWSMEEVIKRWHQLYRGTLLSQEYQRGYTLSNGELISLEETVTIYRQRLYDISWLMRNLNEYIAREANKEDKCTGRFYSPPSLALTLRASWSCSHLFPINLMGRAIQISNLFLWQGGMKVRC